MCEKIRVKEIRISWKKKKKKKTLNLRLNFKVHFGYRSVVERLTPPPTPKKKQNLWPKERKNQCMNI